MRHGKVAYGVHAAVEPVQPTRLDTTPDAMVGYPESEQLADADHAVLAPGNRCEPEIPPRVGRLSRRQRV